MGTLIFDFDGTLVDSLDAFVDSARKLSGTFGYDPNTNVETLRGKSPLQVLRGEFHWSWIKIGRFLRAMRPLVYAGVRKLPLHQGMKAALLKLQKRHTIGVLTSNSADAVREVLDREGIQVSFIHGGGSLFGKDVALRRLFKQQNILRDQAVYIGDEIRDIEACRKAGIRIIAVSWGLNDQASLVAAKPDSLANNPSQLMQLTDAVFRS